MKSAEILFEMVAVNRLLVRDNLDKGEESGTGTRIHSPKYERQLICRLNLQSWLPTELHPEISHLLVGFGQDGLFACPPKIWRVHT
ncbi:hypothetical protein ARMGADRAFT_1085608 [Armillaria gallica]|uniref:Uncharacterized protein n=1 Tax=Armillaria gallica TaxID=47427 RepID=A0A2H3D9R4_ARMGA|nr:hypothetical protein ARMGADRAFT_1085608 [Armillaria gallica]